ncbi:MAG: hypothetical protein J3K34DRAFT_403859 [Monoraphidium minutum]|nr:MAG: hypothetical protein J3K34DRAFT_403859 [Monoraphidium minutum]
MGLSSIAFEYVPVIIALCGGGLACFWIEGGDTEPSSHGTRGLAALAKAGSPGGTPPPDSPPHAPPSFYRRLRWRRIWGICGMTSCCHRAPICSQCKACSASRRGPAGTLCSRCQHSQLGL